MRPCSSVRGPDCGAPAVAPTTGGGPASSAEKRLGSPAAAPGEQNSTVPGRMPIRPIE